MAPEHEARVRVLYDRESDEPRRRRRAVADWGVGEDIFDRMPSRRFARSDRRAEHRDDESRRFARREEAPPRPAESWADEVDEAAPRRAVASWVDEAEEAAPHRAVASSVDEADEAAPRRAVASWVDEAEEPAPAGEDAVGRRRRPVESWLDAGENRTIVIERTPNDEVAEPELEHAPAERRTVVIKGHPERLPAVRPARPPKTAVERLGTSPDRIVAYAVALGFLLVLIAVLTTGQ